MVFSGIGLPKGYAYLLLSFRTLSIKLIRYITLLQRKDNPMRRLIIVASLLVPSTALAAGLNCSIHPPKGTPDSALPGLAKISESEAPKVALAKIKAPSKTNSEGELEIEQGCLVYSFDIKIPGKPGIEEVMVDAGTGKVLSHKHETQKQEQAEKNKEKKAK